MQLLFNLVLTVSTGLLIQPHATALESN